MDIKSKSNKKISLLIAVVIAALFAAGFLVQYPSFEKRADLYDKNADTDGLQSNAFLQRLYQSNYVLYKEFMEKVNEADYSYQELYLETEIIPVSEEQIMNSGNYLENESVESFLGQIESTVEDSFNGWEDQIEQLVTQKMDFCVIDEKTGESIRNTGERIEALAQTGESEQKASLPYVYYVRVSYDSAGNPGRVAVMGRDSDKLLKSVQRMMKNTWMEFTPVFDGYSSRGQAAFYGYSAYTSGGSKMIGCRAAAPKDVTFIYALTQEQKETLVDEGWGRDDSDMSYAYYVSGVQETYLVFLGILTVLVFLLMHYKRYGLYQIIEARIPLEITLTAGALLMGLGAVALVELLNSIDSGYFDLFYEQSLSFLPQAGYQTVTMTVNYVVLLLLFLAWIYLVSTLGEIQTIGIREFLKERSILVRGCRGLYGWCRKLWSRFQEELLHIDLGEKVESTIRKVVLVNFLVLAVICTMWFFGWIGLAVYSLLLYFILKKYMKKIQDQYARLLEATNSIAEGNLNTDFDGDLGVFESYREELYRIQEGFRKAVDEEVRSQRMKTELITNVSHDLKTPLTAICTYIDLLKEEGVTPEQQKEYLAVLEKKSLRLKTLIEDLFEVSKANSQNITMNLVDVDICNLMRQVYLEYEDRAEEANLTFRFRVPEEKIILKLDSQKTYRIFENLYINIIKYAMQGTRVYVDVEKTEENIRIGLKNMSACELHVTPEELTERFVRGDSSRNTEGSGLGLAIAKSFTQLQGGNMEVTVDGDLFKVTLEWKLK